MIENNLEFLAKVVVYMLLYMNISLIKLGEAQT